MNKNLLVGLSLAFTSMVGAQSLSTSGAATASVDSGYVINGAGGVVSITQSVDTATITAANSVSCNAGGLHADNSYIRRFDLDGDHGITGPFDVSSVDFGVETATGAGGSQPVEVRLYSIPNASTLTFANLTLVGSVNISLADASSVVFNTAVAGTVDGAVDDLVVEVFTPDGQDAGHSFFLGSNDAGETGPTFLAAASCSINEPTATADIGFPDMQMVMVVNGALGANEVDLSLNITNNALGELSIGDVVTFTKTVNNAGPGDANNTVVNSVLSGGLQYTSNDCGATANGANITWNAGTVANGGSAVCNVVATVSGFDQQSLTGTVSADETDVVPGNNAGGSSVTGPARVIPSLSFYGILLLMAGMFFVYRRKA